MKIVVLAGGKSAEREVSLSTGKGIAEALASKGHQVITMDVDRELPRKLLQENPDLVYIALHGKFGEDGTVQGMLEVLEFPYTGSGVLASALAMNKVQAKKIFRQVGIPTPKEVILSRNQIRSDYIGVIEIVKEHLSLPVVVKPGSEGSSFGLTIVKQEEELIEAIKKVFLYDTEALIEEYIKGKEITVGIIGNKELEVFPPIEIVPKNEFYDYESKYVKGMSEHLIPARIDPETLEKVIHYAKQAHLSLGCRGLSRVDFMVKETGDVFVLEVNTLPGMTETSLLPDAARAVGLSYADLTEKIVHFAIEAEKND